MNNDDNNPPADTVVSDAGGARYSAVDFRLAENGQLLAELSSNADTAVITLQQIRQNLRELGFAELWLDEKALESVLAKAAMAETGSVVVGERRDARAELHIAGNKRAVHVDLLPPFGGESMSVERLKEVLLSQHVAERCIDDALLAEAVEKGEGNNLLVAKAIEPITGDDGFLDVLIAESVKKTFDSEGEVDFHELQDFVVVEEGAELARLVPATAGIDGEDVLGVAIAAQPGKTIKFSSKLEGAEVSESDPNLLLASVKGHPVVLRDGVNVDPTLVVPNVNLVSGNINFDGSVFVKGSVASGYQVKATGDVIVKDIVDKAVIIAGGNIQIDGGVIGEESKEGLPSSDNPLAERMPTYLQAKGDIRLKYLTMAELKAGQDIVIREYAMHSKLHAGESVMLGQEGGRGALLGGVSRARKHLLANQLGNDTYMKTAVEVGRANEDAKQLKELRVQAQKRQASFDKLSDAESKIRRVERQRPLNDELKAKLAKITETLALLTRQLEKISRSRELLQRRIDAREVATVRVKGVVYPNVSLLVDGLGHQQKQESKAVCYKNSHDELELSSFQPLARPGQ